MTDNKMNIKEQIIEALEDIKEFEVTYSENVTYSQIFKAKSEEELREKFYRGELEFNNGDITDSEMIDDSLEINEW